MSFEHFENMMDKKFEEMIDKMKDYERKIIETKVTNANEEISFDMMAPNGKLRGGCYPSNWIPLTPCWTYLCST